VGKAEACTYIHDINDDDDDDDDGGGDALCVKSQLNNVLYATVFVAGLMLLLVFGA
jgi:hypothetical protein